MIAHTTQQNPTHTKKNKGKYIYNVVINYLEKAVTHYSPLNQNQRAVVRKDISNLKNQIIAMKNQTRTKTKISKFEEEKCKQRAKIDL